MKKSLIIALAVIIVVVAVVVGFTLKNDNAATDSESTAGSFATSADALVDNVGESTSDKDNSDKNNTVSNGSVADTNTDNGEETESVESTAESKSENNSDAVDVQSTKPINGNAAGNKGQEKTTAQNNSNNSQQTSTTKTNSNNDKNTTEKDKSDSVATTRKNKNPDSGKNEYNTTTVNTTANKNEQITSNGNIAEVTTTTADAVTTTAKPSSKDKIQIISVTEKKEIVEVVTNYGVFSYPFAFCDIMSVEAENDKGLTGLRFFAELDGEKVLVYTIYYDNENGMPCGKLRLDKEMSVTVEFEDPSAGVNEDWEATFYAVQETFNDVLYSMAEDKNFTMVY